MCLSKRASTAFIAIGEPTSQRKLLNKWPRRILTNRSVGESPRPVKSATQAKDIELASSGRKIGDLELCVKVWNLMVSYHTPTSRNPPRVPISVRLLPHQENPDNDNQMISSGDAE